MALPFDTLSAAKDLQKAGMDVAQAEAVAMVVKSSHGELATKSDVNWLKWGLGINIVATLSIIFILIQSA